MSFINYPEISRQSSIIDPNFLKEKDFKAKRLIRKQYRISKRNKFSVSKRFSITNRSDWSNKNLVNVDLGTTYKRIIYEEYYRRGGRKTRGQVSKHFNDLMFVIYKALTQRRSVLLSNSIQLLPHVNKRSKKLSIYFSSNNTFAWSSIFNSTYRAKLYKYNKSW